MPSASDAYFQGVCHGIIQEASKNLTDEDNNPFARSWYAKGYQAAQEEFGKAEPIRVAQLNAAVLLNNLMQTPPESIDDRTRVILKAARAVAMLQ